MRKAWLLRSWNVELKDPSGRFPEKVLGGFLLRLRMRKTADVPRIIDVFGVRPERVSILVGDVEGRERAIGVPLEPHSSAGSSSSTVKPPIWPDYRCHLGMC